MKTLNISIDEQRQELIKASTKVLQIREANPHLLGFDDNRWDGYDYAIDRDRNDLITGVRIVNIDGAIQILTFTDYLLVNTFTITGEITPEIVVAIMANQLELLHAGTK